MEPKEVSTRHPYICCYDHVFLGFYKENGFQRQKNKKRYSGKSLEAIRLLQRQIVTYHLIGHDRKEVTAQKI